MFRRTAAHVRVGIDAAGNDQPALGLDDAVGFDVDLLCDHGDQLAVDQDVSVVVVGRGDDAAVADDRPHEGSFLVKNPGAILLHHRGVGTGVRSRAREGSHPSASNIRC